MRYFSVLMLLGAFWGLSSEVQSQSVLSCEPGKSEAYLDANNVNALILNSGSLFFSHSKQSYEVPRGSGKHAIFASSLWLGGMVDEELRVSASTYGPYEFWPGSYSQVVGSGNCVDFDRIYEITYTDIDEFKRTGIATQDMLDWPWLQGAKVVDGDGDPFNYNLEGGDLPELLGSQTLFWIMNDVGGPHLRSGSHPLGVDVLVTAFSTSHYQSYYPTTTFYRYQIVNRNIKPIEDAYFGFFSDIDLGSAFDDYIGSDSTLNLSYSYNADNNDDNVYRAAPPAVGVQILQSPLATNDNLDNDDDGEVDEDGEMLGMSSSIYYHKGGSAATGDPRDAIGFYNYLNGLWANGSPFTVGGNGFQSEGKPTKFVYSGMPPGYWSEMNSDSLGTAISPADRRNLANVGPFRLDPGERTEVLVAIHTTFGSDHLNSVVQLKKAAKFFNGFTAHDIPTWPLNGGNPPAPIAEIPSLLTPTSGAKLSTFDVDFVFDSIPREYSLQVEITRLHDREIIEDFYTIDLSHNFKLDPFTQYSIQSRFVKLTRNRFGPWSAPIRFTAGGVNSQNQNLLKSILVVQNGSGPIPPTGAVPSGWGFPGITLPAPRQQVSGAQWALSNYRTDCYDNCYKSLQFMHSTGISSEESDIAPYDWEIRFDDEENWGELYHNGQYKLVRIPFSVWRVGINTPNDRSDDVRFLVGLESLNDNTVFDLSDVVHPGMIESGSRVTDSFSIFDISNPIPGSVDYDNWLIAAQQETRNRSTMRSRPEFFNDLTLIRVEPATSEPTVPTSQLMPESGTIIRIETLEPVPPMITVPKMDQSFPAGPIRLFWQAYKNSHLLIAKDLAFSQIVRWTERSATGDLTIPSLDIGTYYVKAVDGFGGTSETVRFYVGTSTANEAEAVPDQTTLLENYPNPFKGSTTLSYSVREPGIARMEVFDLLGRRIASLLDEYVQGTPSNVVFNASGIPGGIYVVRLSTKNESITRMITILH